MRTNHAIGYFVNRAVATQHQNEVRSLRYRLPGSLRAVAGRTRRQQAWMEARARKRRDGTLESTLGVPPEFTSGWIVDENRPLIGCDSLSITRIP